MADMDVLFRCAHGGRLAEFCAAFDAAVAAGAGAGDLLLAEAASGAALWRVLACSPSPKLLFHALLAAQDLSVHLVSRALLLAGTRPFFVRMVAAMYVGQAEPGLRVASEKHPLPMVHHILEGLSGPEALSAAAAMCANLPDDSDAVQALQVLRKAGGTYDVTTVARMISARWYRVADLALQCRHSLAAAVGPQQEAGLGLGASVIRRVISTMFPDHAQQGEAVLRLLAGQTNRLAGHTLLHLCARRHPDLAYALGRVNERAYVPPGVRTVVMRALSGLPHDLCVHVARFAFVHELVNRPGASGVTPLVVAARNGGTPPLDDVAAEVRAQFSRLRCMQLLLENGAQPFSKNTLDTLKLAAADGARITVGATHTFVPMPARAVLLGIFEGEVDSTMTDAYNLRKFTRSMLAGAAMLRPDAHELAGLAQQGPGPGPGHAHGHSGTSMMPARRCTYTSRGCFLARPVDEIEELAQAPLTAETEPFHDFATPLRGGSPSAPSGDWRVESDRLGVLVDTRLVDPDGTMPHDDTSICSLLYAHVHRHMCETCPKRDELCSTVFWAAMRMHAACASRLIHLGAGVDDVGTRGRTPLAVAATLGDVATVKVLVSAGADVNLPSCCLDDQGESSSPAGQLTLPDLGSVTFHSDGPFHTTVHMAWGPVVRKNPLDMAWDPGVVEILERAGAVRQAPSGGGAPAADDNATI